MINEHVIRAGLFVRHQFNIGQHLKIVLQDNGIWYTIHILYTIEFKHWTIAWMDAI